MIASPIVRSPRTVTGTGAPVATRRRLRISGLPSWPQAAITSRPLVPRRLVNCPFSIARPMKASTDGLRGGGPRRIAAGVVGNDVERAAKRAKVLADLVAVLEAVVDAGDEHVFHADRGLRAPRPAEHRVHQIIHRPGAVDGHDLGADRVVGGVEAHREVEPVEARFRGELAEPADAVRVADGRDGDVGRGDGGAVVVGEHADRGDHRVEVVGGLAHAHEHDVLRPMSDLMRGRVPLGHDVGRLEIPEEAHLGGLAESTPHGAADLARDAERPGGGAVPAPHRNHHRLGLQSRRAG